ncbi:MAG: hypothetical protein IJ552_11540 [Prevotella sp.]|nr:hypothetical protein [Prevotella sp.]
MNIQTAPDNLSLVGNMKHLVVDTTEDVSFSIKVEGSSSDLVERVYSPNGNHLLEINLYDIVFPTLSFYLQNVQEPYRQADIVKTFVLTLKGVASRETKTKAFTVVRGGVDRLADTAENFLQQNFLTWQPNIKPVTYYTPEFLTYYAAVASKVKCKARVDSNDVTVTLASIPAGQAWTIPVQYAIIAGKVNGLPSYYDVWVEDAGGQRLTYIQRYFAQDMKSESEQWILFENSLGGIDTFRAYGSTDLEAAHSHNVAEIEEISSEYRVDTERKFKKNTGRLDRKERLWLLDFFPSLAKYLYVGDYLRQIVVTDSDVNYKASELPSQYNFTYRYADAKPYLNIPRTDAPLEILDIDIPEVGSFTVAPRLVEFPRIQLSSGALFPVQDPYGENWKTTTLGALFAYFLELILDQYDGKGGVGHMHPNLDFLNNLSWDNILRKDADDTARGVITFMKGLSSSERSSFVKGVLFGATGVFRIDGDGDARLREVILESLRSENFMSGLRGWNIDRNGNAEVGTLHVRDTLEVDELRINRQQAQEGDTIFSDNDQILEVEEQIDETDGSVSYVLTLKEKWEGYFTAQMYGNILRGKINTLAAKEAGVSDYSKDTEGQEQDSGRNLYYTSFMTVTATHNTTPSLLGVNQIRVVLFGDDDVPMSRNFPPCPMMAIARWGCVDYSDEYVDDPSYETVKADIRRRQQLFVLSSNDGRIVKLVGVSKPILEDGNIGATFGTLPEFVRNSNPEVAKRVFEGRDYLYAQGVVVGDFIQTDIQGVPVPTVVNVGDWVDGAQIQDPSVGNGIYLSGEFNEQNQRYETHAVRHRNGTWRCLMHQPVKSGGNTTYYEPKWNSPYWQLIDGNGNLSMEFSSSRGHTFRVGAVNTVVTPYVYYGNVDITQDISEGYFSWERQTDGQQKTDADMAWDANHIGTRTLTLSNQDMPIGWGVGKSVIFTCKCAVNDGKSENIVENQVII